MSYTHDTTESQRILSHTYKMVRDRLRCPCSAVIDEGIDLKRQKKGFREWPYEKETVIIIPVIPEPLPVVSQPLRDWLYLDRANKFPPHFLHYIKSCAAREFETTIAALESDVRTKGFVFPRHAAIYLCREMMYPFVSFPVLGRHFGRRDHTTILHSVQRTEPRMKADALYCHQIADVLMFLQDALRQWRCGCDLPPVPAPKEELSTCLSG